MLRAPRLFLRRVAVHTPRPLPTRMYASAGNRCALFGRHCPAPGLVAARRITASARRRIGTAASRGGDDDPPARVGRIEIITGPMFAGKSTELLRRVAEHRAAGRTVAVISSSRDTRYADGGAIATHAGRTAAAVAVDALADVDAASPSTAHADVVAIDEAQFFDDLVPYATAAADGRGQTVVVAGLDGDAARRPFGGVLTLIPHAERVDRLAASCAWCGRDAHFSVRLGGGEGAVVVVGGADTYAPACRSHYAASGHLPPPPRLGGATSVPPPTPGAVADRRRGVRT